MASVFLGDLSDFIEPSQSCINPLFTGSDAAAGVAAAPSESGGAKLVLDACAPDPELPPKRTWGKWQDDMVTGGF